MGMGKWERGGGGEAWMEEEVGKCACATTGSAHTPALPVCLVAAAALFLESLKKDGEEGEKRD